MHSALKEKTRAKGPNTPLKAALLTSMGSTSKSEAASKLKAKSGDPHTSKPPTGASTPVAAVTPKTSPHELDADDLDLAAMNLLPRVGDAEDVPSRHLPVKDRRKLLEEVSRTLNDASDGRKMLSLVVIGKDSAISRLYLTGCRPRRRRKVNTSRSIVVRTWPNRRPDENCQ